MTIKLIVSVLMLALVRAYFLPYPYLKKRGNTAALSDLLFGSQIADDLSKEELSPEEKASLGPGRIRFKKDTYISDYI